ncbi:hypothetical protein HMPREF9069_00066 [Atopobium sp. oral taxon 810 str. F0209]|nr:hypothetical protein HMPREF9069_00066 [Atopobium sp. oral taxon 810 str. F0209]
MGEALSWSCACWCKTCGWGSAADFARTIHAVPLSFFLVGVFCRFVTEGAS